MTHISRHLQHFTWLFFILCHFSSHFTYFHHVPLLQLTYHMLCSKVSIVFPLYECLSQSYKSQSTLRLMLLNHKCNICDQYPLQKARIPMFKVIKVKFKAKGLKKSNFKKEVHGKGYLRKHCPYEPHAEKKSLTPSS